MRNLFIQKDEEFKIKFYVAVDQEGLVWAEADENNLNNMLNPDKTYEKKNFSVTFKRPSFGDTISLYDDIFKTKDGANVDFNPLAARYQKISLLIKDWDLEDSDGNKVKASIENVKSLHPIIANAIGIQLDTETGGLLS
ncbi:hypothetical protein LCGC14_1384810 [marine sediment metagenome]|uniref:Uncharacterized protein n=1 Tax=marine sediment metagenome TaxID=412755 RepID=A0A0F9MH38_9ZZZZ